MEHSWGSSGFVARKFRDWYLTNSGEIKGPTHLMRREFAFLEFNSRMMHRHIGFNDLENLRNYFKLRGPAHSYYSSSYYEKPNAPMNEKIWNGADLIFDIDADHFILGCQENHDRWLCRNCGLKGKGRPPGLCECGKASYITETWLCEDCLQAAKHETNKLLDILIQDFGFIPDEDVACNFSGNRGYHVHVLSSKIRKLDQEARREVVNYIMGLGLNPEYLGFSSSLRGGVSSLAETGWRGRAARAFYDFLTAATEEDVDSLKLGREQSRILKEERDEIIGLLLEKHPSQITRFLTKDTVKKAMTVAIKMQASEIDTVVTTDIHRLIRLPFSLHGKTAWQVQPILLDNLADYDPFDEAVAFDGEDLRLKVRWVPKFRIRDDYYGPFEGEEVTLPLAAALFVLCKGGGMISS
jgi:DNA primase small subunit